MREERAGTVERWDGGVVEKRRKMICGERKRLFGEQGETGRAVEETSRKCG